MQCPRFLVCALVAAGAGLHAQPVLDLPAVVVLSPRIANQSPVTTFATPVSALRYEPAVDVQTRNMAEGQADISIQGGIFENTGMLIGGLTLLDPQTGHYLAEVPVPPVMLGAPEVRTGAANALGSLNVNVGTIAYAWREIPSAGLLAVGAGQHGFRRQELHQGVTSSVTATAKLGAEVAYARSESDGPIAFGDHEFERIAGRLQWRDDRRQTDVFAGYQAKFFGWPNLYTPYGVPETENLQTLLFIVNHRVEREAAGHFEAGAYYRRNKDDYEYDRRVPGQFNLYQHKTHVRGASVSGREVRGDWALLYRSEVAADELQSTALTHGSYQRRTMTKSALATEYTTPADGAGNWHLRGGATWDDSNRDGGRLSPVVSVTRELPPGEGLQHYGLAYAHSTQLPSYTALNSAPASGLFRGNPDLGRSRSRHLGLNAAGRTHGWVWQAELFERRDDDLVDWTYREGQGARTANPVDTITRGVELVGRRDFDAGSVTVGYAWLDKESDYGTAAVDASFYALNYARHRLTAALTLRLGRGVELRMDNEVRLQAANALRSAGGDEAVLSSLALHWRPTRNAAWEVALQVDNLWGSEFQEVPAVPAAPRQWAVSVAHGW